MFFMTVFDDDGSVLFDQEIKAITANEAKEKGYQWLQENECAAKAHRIFTTAGKLISFCPHHHKK